MKKYFSIAIAIVLFISLFSASAFAGDTGERTPSSTFSSENDPILDDGGIIQILPPNRINSDGTFSFNFTTSVKSTNFKINTLYYSYINIIARITDNNGKDVTSSNPNVPVKLTILKKGLFSDTALYTFNFIANNTQYNFLIGTSDSSSTFYFMLENKGNLAAGTKISGSGSLGACTIL